MANEAFDLNSGAVLAQELAQAIISNDDKAAIIAGIVALIGKGRIDKVGPPVQTIAEAKATMAALSDSVKRGQADVKALSQQQSNKPAARRALS